MVQKASNHYHHAKVQMKLTLTTKYIRPADH